jgi:heat shock protein HslJ
MMFDADETAFVSDSFGFQPSLLAYTYAWIANFGVAKTAKTFAPDERSFTTCAWTLTSIQPAGRSRQDRPAEANYSITFSDGRLSTRADCNVCNGSFSVKDSTLTAASVLACTRAACPTMEFETAYTSLLSGDSNTVIAGNTLTLSSARGVLTFTR